MDRPVWTVRGEDGKPLGWTPERLSQAAKSLEDDEYFELIIDQPEMTSTKKALVFLAFAQAALTTFSAKRRSFWRACLAWTAVRFAYWILK